MTVPPLDMPPAGFRAGRAISYGWQQFKRAPGDWILLQLAVLGIVLVLIVPILIFTVDWQSDVAFDKDPRSLAGNVLATLLANVVTAAFVKAALLQTDSGFPSLGASLSVVRNPHIWVLSLIIAVLSTALDFVFFGLSFALFLLTIFAWIYVIDAGLDAVTAIGSGLGILRRNIAANLVLLVLSALVMTAGVLACLIGVFVTFPIITIAYVYAYRLLRPAAV